MLDTSFSILVLALLFAFGASMGSFWHLVSDRLPKGQSIVYPPSFCNSCQTAIPWYGLIPVLGWFLTSGKCKSCAQPVSVLHPIVETIAGLGTAHIVLHYIGLDRLNLLLYSHFGKQSWTAGLGAQETVSMITTLWFFYVAIPLIIIDVRFRLLPNKLTILGLVGALVLGAFNPDLGWKGSLMGALVGGFSLFAVAKIYSTLRHREGLGFGDVKYLGFIGACVGWQKVFLCLGVSSFLGTLVGLGMLLLSAQKRRLGLQVSVPFGPFLAGGTLLVMLYGDHILVFLLKGGFS
jgi:leader peptidase (prepilin peptidase) / N-methyltransferase